MKLKSLTLLSVLMIMLGCTDATQEAEERKTDTIQEEENGIEEDNEWDNITVLSGGFRFSLKVPSEKIANSKSLITYHEDRGDLEIKAGKMYDLLISEDDFNMSDVKDEINNHPFYKVEMIMENDSSLIYRYYTEEAAKETWQIYAERELDGVYLIIKSNPEMEFNEYETRKMMESTLSITPF